MKANTPYVKKYENGVLTNPITKDNPYLFAPVRKRIARMHRFWHIVQNKFFTGRTVVKD